MLKASALYTFSYVSKDTNLGKLTVNEYYFIKHRTDGSKVLNGLVKLDVVGRGAQVGSNF